MAGYVSLFSFTRTLWIWRNLSPWLASHFRSIIFSVSPFFCFSFALLSVVLLLCSSPVIFFVFTTPLFPSFVLHLLFVVRHILRLPLFPLPWPQPRPSACTRFILPSRGSRRGRGRGGSPPRVLGVSFPLHSAALRIEILLLRYWLASLPASLVSCSPSSARFACFLVSHLRFS